MHIMARILHHDDWSSAEYVDGWLEVSILEGKLHFTDAKTGRTLLTIPKPQAISLGRIIVEKIRWGNTVFNSRITRSAHCT